MGFSELNCDQNCDTNSALLPPPGKRPEGSEGAEGVLPPLYIDPEETSLGSGSFGTAPSSISSDTDACKICHCGGEVDIESPINT